MDERRQKVVLLAPRYPKPTNAYLIEQLVAQGLIDAAIVVKPGGPFERCRRVWNAAQRQGVESVLRRARANRLRRKELGAYRERYLVRRLFPTGYTALRLPHIEVIATGRLNSKLTAAALESLAPAIAIQAGVGIIGRPLLDIPSRGTLSLHHGVMPAIRGMDSILWSFVENRRDWAGVTVQLVNEGLDTGRIVAQASLRIGSQENPFSAVATATVLGAEMMASSIRWMLASNITNGWPCKEFGTGTYRSSLTAGAIRRLGRICEERNEQPGSEAICAS